MMKHKRSYLLVVPALLLLICATMNQAYPAHGAWRGAAPSAGDWPMYQGDPTRSGANLNETTITPATAADLTEAWKFTTGGPVVASPVVASGVLYTGSWDGYEYAVDIATHQQLWRQYLGLAPATCYPTPLGVTSTAAVAGSALFVGGGDGYLYALNTVDGSVLWKTLLGTPPYYNWSSPLVYNNLVYIGLANYCEPPYAVGQVLAFNQSDGSLAASVTLVPSGHVGATVWSSPAIDPVAGRMFVTTGNNANAQLSSEPEAEAFVALDPASLAVLDHWQIPASDEPLGGDSDFGATPTLFNVNGVGYVGALNKNGIYYALNRSNLAAGPVWKQVVGGTPLKQAAHVSSSCFANGVIYVGAGPINGTSSKGSIHAFDGATGTLLWAANTAGYMTGSVTCAPGLVVDNQGKTVEIRAAATGHLLFSYATGNTAQGTSIISNGMLYTPSRDGSVYAFTVLNANVPQLIFQDAFDAYTPGPLPLGTGTTQWTSVAVAKTGFGVSVSSARANSLPNALQFTLSGVKGGRANARKTYQAGTGYTTHAARFRLYLDPALQFAGQTITLFSTQNLPNATDGALYLHLTSAHALQMVRYTSLGQKITQTLTTQLNLGQWYTLELDQVNDPVNGSWSLWLNSVQVGGQSGVDTGNLPVNTILPGDSVAATGTTLSGSFYEDDIVTAATPHIG